MSKVIWKDCGCELKANKTGIFLDLKPFRFAWTLDAGAAVALAAAILKYYKALTKHKGEE